jgi:uncharacterized Zn finger protein (UPF0148 family)
MDPRKRKPGTVTFEVHTGRCSACKKRFNLFPSTGTAICPHCKEAYFFHEGQWQNEKLRNHITNRNQTDPPK